MKKILFYLIILLTFLSCSEKSSVPIYDYYKNIPKLRGWTSDENQKNYMIEVILVYREGNSELQTKINLLKPSILDALRGYFSSLKEADYVIENQKNLKLTAVKLLNTIILDSMVPKQADKLRGIEDLEELDLILDINIMQLQIFSLD